MRILLNDILQNSDADDNLKSPALSDNYKVDYITKKIEINFNEPFPINAIGIGNLDYDEKVVIDGWEALVNYKDIRDGGYANSIYNTTIGSTEVFVEFDDYSPELLYDGGFSKTNFVNLRDGGYADSVYTTLFSNTKFSFVYEGAGLYPMHIKKPIIASKMIVTFNPPVSIVGRIGAGIAINIPTAIPKEPAWCSTSEPRITLSGQIVQGKGGYNYRVLSLDSRYKIDNFAINELINGYKYIGMGYPFFIDLDTEAYKLPFRKFYGIDKNQQNISFEGGIRRFLYSRKFEFRECF